MREESPPGRRQSARERRQEEACKGCWVLAGSVQGAAHRQQAARGNQLEVIRKGRRQKKGQVCVSWASLARSPVTPSLPNA